LLSRGLVANGNDNQSGTTASDDCTSITLQQVNELLYKVCNYNIAVNLRGAAMAAVTMTMTMTTRTMIHRNIPDVWHLMSVAQNVENGSFLSMTTIFTQKSANVNKHKMKMSSTITSKHVKNS